MSDTFRINWGSDLVTGFYWLNQAEQPANLTGFEIAVIEQSPIIEGHLAVTLENPGQGLVAINLPWDESFPRGREIFFRIQVTSGDGLQSSTNKLWVEYK